MVKKTTGLDWFKQNFHFRFQFSLVTLIVVILCLTSFSILYAIISISRTVSTHKAEQLFEETGYRVEELLNEQLEQAIRLSHLFAVLPGVANSVEGNGMDYAAIPFMSQALKTHSTLYSIYTGFQDGKFIQFIHAAGDPRIIDVHQAPKETEFILRSISFNSGPSTQKTQAYTGKTEYWTFFDASMTIISARQTENPDYNPTERVWYTMVDQLKNQAVLTRPYLFHSLKKPGITASVRASDNAVIGVDITLAYLKTFLNELNISPGTGLAIVDDQDRILATNTQMEHWLEIQDASLKNVQDIQSDRKKFLVQGTSTSAVTLEEDDMIWMRPWETPGGQKYKFIIVTPMSDLLGHLQIIQNRIILITLLLIVLFFPVVILGSRNLSRFLEILSDDAGKIQNMDFDGEIPDFSLILEFEQLSRAFHLMKQTVAERTQSLEISMKKLERIIDLGITMAVEKDSDRLVELILKGAKELSHADGGSLYLKGEDDSLDFKIVLNDSLDIAQGGTSSNPVLMPPVPLYDKDGKPNLGNVVTYAFHTNQTIAIGDAYEDKNFNFTGPRSFDEANNYRSKSFLTVPLTLQGSEVIGALQLINSISPETGENVPFHRDIQKLVEALSAEAAAVLYNRNLLKSHNQLFESLIRLIADAIDTKSPYTGGHCARVPKLALMLAEEAEKCDQGPLAEFQFESDEDRQSFQIGAWLHDAGKAITPEYVVDKATKLETIYNRIHEIRTRFEVLLRDVRLEEKEALLNGTDPAAAAETRTRREQELKDDFAFVAECNSGATPITPEAGKRLQQIAQQTWYRNFDPSLGLSREEQERFKQNGGTAEPGVEFLLADKPEHIIPFSGDINATYSQYGFILPETDCLYNRGEVHNLSIPAGTLTTEERLKINEHIMQTIVMLEHLPFPKHLTNVPKYAGTHHEKLDGTGYPRGLDASQLSIPSRIMAIADIFEALTASDRPYKKAKTLSEALSILHQFKKNHHIDPNLFDLFLTSGVYRQYAERFLSPAQLDEVDIGQFLGPV